jgi:hypothetical protein
VALLLAAPLVALGDDQKTDKPAGSPREQFQAVLAEYSKANADFLKAARAAQTGEDRQKVLGERGKLLAETAKRVMELADKNTGDPVAIDAAVWVMSNAQFEQQAAGSLEKANTVFANELVAKGEIGTVKQRLARTRLMRTPEAVAQAVLDRAGKEKEEDALTLLTWLASRAASTEAGAKATAKLFSDHLQSEKLAEVCQALAAANAPNTEENLRKAMEKSQHAKVQAAACFALATVIKNRSQRRGAAPDDIKQWNKEAEELFAKVAEKLGDAAGPMKGQAEKELYELRHLAVGKNAPEIEGEDTDGKPMKLTDYRGKVVLLDFWGFW